MSGTMTKHFLLNGFKAIGIGMALVALAFGLTYSLRSSGALETIELGAYDTLFALTSQTSSTTRNDIIIVAHTEADEARFGAILSDDLLTKLLMRIDAEEPLAIGLDLIRDRAEPSVHAASSTPSLQNTLSEMENLVAIVKDSKPSFSAPPVLAERDERLGAADIIVDGDGVVRRGLLFVTAKGKTRPTLALQLAARKLQQNGIGMEWRDDRLKLGAALYQPLIPSQTGYYQDASLDGGYQYLLRYPACSAGFEQYKTQDILDRKETPDLAGKIVLVGNMLELSKDLFVAPDTCSDLAGRRLFGVTLQAQMTAQLIDQAAESNAELLTTGQRLGHIETGFWLDNLWIAFWCVLGVLLVMRAGRAWVLLLLATATLLGLLALSYGAFAAWGWWLPLVPPATAFVLAIALTGALSLTSTRVERDSLYELLSGVVSKRVADVLWHERSSRSNNEHAPPELMMATVMFTDIKGFTTISEQLPEPILATWLNEYLEAMVDIVADYDGIIEKFAGDGLTIEFGPPDRRTTTAEIEADARNALASAMAMGVRLDELNRSWSARNWPEIGIRIGIHTGELMVGTVGGATRFQYSVIGDTANTAARLEAYGKDDPSLQANVGECRIFLSEATRQYLGPEVKVEFVGHLNLRGKSNDVTVYRAIAPTLPRNVLGKEE